MKSLALFLATGISALALAATAQAADLIVDPAPMPGVVEAGGSWDGVFVGAFGGYGWAEPGFPSAPPVPVEPEGWLLGVDAGVNFTLTDGIVAGVVGDIAWADLSGTGGGGGSIVNSNIDWLGSVRGRVGFDGGSFLPYLTAGLAFAHQTIDTEAPIVTSGDATHIGWTVGAGVEVAVTENLSVDVLYRYSDYGDATYTFNGNSGELGLTGQTLTVGLNFGF